MGTKTYPVLGRLDHDGRLYDPFEEPGVTIELDEEVAAGLPDGVLGEPIETPDPAEAQAPTEKPAAPKKGKS